MLTQEWIVNVVSLTLNPHQVLIKLPPRNPQRGIAHRRPLTKQYKRFRQLRSTVYLALLNTRQLLAEVRQNGILSGLHERLKPRNLNAIEAAEDSTDLDDFHFLHGKVLAVAGSFQVYTSKELL